MKNNKKELFSFFANATIVFMELIGVILSLKRRGVGAFLFYTENVNYFTLLVSLWFVLEYLIKQKTSKIVNCFRFISSVCLAVTFVMVTTILIPMFPESFMFMMFEDSNLYQHFLCPTISILSLILFENKNKLHKTNIIFALIPTLVYGIVMVTLNLLKVIAGPYPFFYLYQIRWYLSIPWLIGVLLIVVAIDLFVFWLHNKKFLSKKIK